MTICFIGCNCKYDIEAVVKLFIPLESFGFVFDGDIPESGDICKVISDNGMLEISVSMNGRSSENSCTEEEAAAEGLSPAEALCRMLFLSLKELTGNEPRWGCLTGIRPVKKVNSLIAEGMSEEDITGEFRRKYLTLPEKTHLAYMTAVTQRPALETLRAGTFSLYISVPFCPTRCSYCSFVSHSIQSAGAAKLIPEYTEKLCEEIALTAEAAGRSGLALDTIYIGGGTPTAIPAECLDRIMKKTAECFDISKVREYTVEAGRADTITAEKLHVIKENGAKRISINPQSLNDDVLKAIGRRHTAEQVIECCRLARSVGFDSINMDTIAGLPSDTPESFRRTIDTVIGLEPENITVHTLTVKRSSRLFADRENTGREISADYAGEMVSYASGALTAAGYSPYYLYRQKNTVGNLENVGYSLAGKESLYNIYIMEETQTILAAGAGGSSKLYDRSTGRIERVVNFKYPYEYISRFDEVRERKNEILRFYGAL